MLGNRGVSLLRLATSQDGVRALRVRAGYFRSPRNLSLSYSRVRDFRSFFRFCTFRGVGYLLFPSKISIRLFVLRYAFRYRGLSGDRLFQGVSGTAFKASQRLGEGAILRVRGFYFSLCGEGLTFRTNRLSLEVGNVVYSLCYRCYPALFVVFVL